MRKHCDILIPAMGRKITLTNERLRLEERIHPLHVQEMAFCDAELRQCSLIGAAEAGIEANQPGKPGANPNQRIVLEEVLEELLEAQRLQHKAYLRLMRTLRPLYAERKRLLAEEAKCDRIIAWSRIHYAS